MPLPRMPQRAFYSVGSDGTGTLDSADLWRTLADRGEWLESRRLKATAWADGEHGRLLAAGSVTEATVYTIGTCQCPTAGEPDDVVAYLYVESYTTGNTTYYARVLRRGGDGRLTVAGEAQTIGTPSATGWISATIAIPADADGDVWLWIYGDATAATNQRVTSCCLVFEGKTTMRDGSTSATTWSKLSLAHVDADDRPDDVRTFEIIRDQQNFLAARVPRTLTAHSFTKHTGTAGSDVTLRYKVRRAADTNDLRVRVRYKQASTCVNNGSVSVYVDGSLSDTQNLSGTSAAWIDCTAYAADMGTTDKTYEIKVVVTPGTDVDVLPTAVTVYGCLVWELDSARTANDWKVAADTMPGAFYATSRAGQYEPGAAIVSDYGTERRSDRATQADNATFQGYRRTQILVADWIWRDITSASDASTYYRNATSDGWESPAEVGRVKWITSYGCTGVELWGLFRRSGVVDFDKWPRIGVWKDAATDPGATLTLWSATDGVDYVWRPLGTFSVSAATDTEFVVKAGWVNAEGVGVTNATDAAVLEGLLVREVY